MAIGSLAVRVTSNTTAFNQGLKASGRSARQFGQDMSGTVSAAGAMAAAVTAAAAGVAVLINRSVQSGKELSNLSKLANSSTTEFQKMAFAAKTVGIEQDKLADILKDVNDRVGDFMSTGGGEMAEFFEKIAPQVGVTAEQFRRLSGPQALQLYVSSLQKANLSQQEMTFYMEAVADDATRLLPLLRNNGKAMEEQAKHAAELGIVMSQIEVEQLRQAGIAIDKSTEILNSFLDQFAAEMSPVLVAFSDLLEENAKDIGGVGEAASDSFGYVVQASGFVLDAIDGVDRAFELAGQTVAGFGLGAVEVMLRVANAVVNKPIQAINELIEKINEFTGSDFEPVSISELGKNIQSELKTVLGAQDAFVQSLHDTLMRPLPSSQFEEFVRNAKETSEAAAAEIVKINSAVATTPVSEPLRPEQQKRDMGPDGTPNAAEIMAREEEKAALKREAMMAAFEQEFLLTEEFNIRMAELRDLYEESDLASQAQYQQARLDKMRSFFSEQYGIQSSGYDALGNLAASFWNAETAMAVDAFGQILNAFSGNSRKIFEIQKAAGIANAIVSTYMGASKALELGWPLGPIAAAGIIAKGFANVQAIRSQSFSGGSSGGGSASGGGSLPGVGAAAQQQQQTQQPTETLIANLSVTGQVFDRKTVIGLVEQINDLQEDGMRVRLRTT